MKMYRLPKKLQSFTPYEPLTGDYKIRLDANESYFEIPTDQVVAAVMNINKVKLNRYPDPYSNAAVRAFSELFEVDEKYVVAGNGSDELIGLIMAGLLEKGDKVLILTPDFSMYGFYAHLYELQVDVFEKNSDLKFDVDEIISYINENEIKCLFFSNPCNPTSLGLEKDDAERIVAETRALIVVDEAYMDFWEESQSMLDEVENYNNLVVLRTCSKSVALAGIRLGFAVACERITNSLKTVKSPFNVNSLTQAIGAAVLSDGDGYRKSIQVIKEATLSLRDAMEGLRVLRTVEKVYKTKTNFVFVKVAQAREIYEFMLANSVAIRCFEIESQGYLRICAGTHAEMNEFARLMAEWKAGDIEGSLGGFRS
jgi:histidinol-phosphate aminotransferase